MHTAPKPLFFPPIEPRNPYKGLHAFTADDACDFFGREALVHELTTVLQQILVKDTKGKHSTRMLTVLLGASGSGKSSVVMAGLLPFLQRQGITNSQEWIYLDPMRPGNHPLEALASTLAQHPALHTFGNLLSISEALASDSLRTLHLVSRQLVGSSSRKVVLFIDQFEEAFTLTDSEEERKHFFDLLITAVTEPQGPLLVLLTLQEYRRKWWRIGPTFLYPTYTGILIYTYAYTGSRNLPDYLVWIEAMGLNVAIFAKDLPDLFDVLSLLAPLVLTGLFVDLYRRSKEEGN